MSFEKITDADLKDKGVFGLPDIPELSTAEMQAKFDELAKTVIIPKLNKLIDDLSASTASGDIGVTVPEGFTASENIQSLLDEIAEIAIKSKEVNTLLTNIESVSNTVSDDETALATCKSVFDYVIQMGGGDMTKAVYDKDNDGVVDDSAKLGGKDSSAYLKKDSVVDSADVAAAVTEKGIPIGCMAFAELKSELGNCAFRVQEDGAYVIYTPPGGADPVSKKLGEQSIKKTVIDTTVYAASSVSAVNQTVTKVIDVSAYVTDSTKKDDFALEGYAIIQNSPYQLTNSFSYDEYAKKVTVTAQVYNNGSGVYGQQRLTLSVYTTE